MHTFNIHSLNITNLTLPQVVIYLSEYFAINGYCEIPDITSELTGEIINDYEFYFSNNKEVKYTLEQLLDIIPYFNSLGTLNCDNL